MSSLCHHHVIITPHVINHVINHVIIMLTSVWEQQGRIHVFARESLCFECFFKIFKVAFALSQ